jgi:hypothetical protein
LQLRQFIGKPAQQAQNLLPLTAVLDDRTPRPFVDGGLPHLGAALQVSFQQVSLLQGHTPLRQFHPHSTGALMPNEKLHIERTS